jgi:hypothetical protein
VIVEVAELPWFSPTLFGEADRRNPGAWTAIVSSVVAVRPPAVAVMAKVVVPGVAELLAVSVSTLLPEVGFVPHTAVTPLGSVEVRARLTFPENPPAPVTVSVVELEPLWLMETLLDEVRIQKPGTCGPAKASIRPCPFALPQPVTRS